MVQSTASSTQKSERRVRDLLAKMNLREKVGQMTQLEIGMITDGAGPDIRVARPSCERPSSSTASGRSSTSGDDALPVEKWHEIIKQIQAVGRDAAEGSRSVRARHHSWRELHPRRNALSAAARDGRHVESGADAAGSRIAAEKRARRASRGISRRSSTSAATIRSGRGSTRRSARTPTLVTVMGVGNRARISGGTIRRGRGRGSSPRGQALHRLLDAAHDRQRRHAGADPRADAPRVLPAAVRRRGQGWRAQR